MKPSRDIVAQYGSVLRFRVMGTEPAVRPPDSSSETSSAYRSQGDPTEGAAVATPKEREEQRKLDRQREFDRQVDAGSLVVRQMTPEERAKYAETPAAAAEREARRARKRGS